MAPFILIAITLLCVAFLFAQLLYLGAQGDVTNQPHDVTEMRRHLWLRSLYVNPHDTRGWVPKTSGHGYTVNFRTKQNAALFLGLVSASTISALGLIALVLYGSAVP